MRAALVALVALDLFLAALAWRYGASVIRDGAGTVTNGFNVLLSIMVGLAVAAAWELWRPLPRRLKRATQIFFLGAIALHALGHLAGFYYAWRPFDDVLHTFITGVAAVLAMRHAQALGLFPSRHSRPLRAALLAGVLALAIAGAWEIFEYTMDSTQGTREQDDLADTMQDMIDGAIGGALAGAWAYARPKPAHEKGRMKG